MIKVQVDLRRSYDVMIGQGLLEALGEKVRTLLPDAEKAVLVTDDNVAALYQDIALQSLHHERFETKTFSIAPGEMSKNSDQYISLLNALAKEKVTRTDVIIALGGGVVGDLAGFAAATYLRGIAYIQVPTTLLAMVDSSVGGKTAIDLPSGKNLAGAFYQPHLVLCDIAALHTLPEHVLNEGYAEIIKYGMLSSRDILEQLLQPSSKVDIASLIADCVTIKRDIVREDELDTGKRQLLNLGHTIGHAIERLSGYGISHGFAISIGMAIMTRAAVIKAACPPECLEVLSRLLAHYKLPDRTEFSAEALFSAALNDKKRAGSMITDVIPVALGETRLKKMPIESLQGWIETGWLS
ncbi:MAG: 3-dehydroquinate synthase [Oscillospiraceae bacterium]|nr:3-dehydroquinate synthase [Oscillospiraceae bacterium]